MKRAALLSLVALLLLSCLSLHSGRLSSVRVGMSSSQVLAVAGSPDQIIGHDDPGGWREEWIYQSEHAKLLFEKNVLISMAW